MPGTIDTKMEKTKHLIIYITKTFKICACFFSLQEVAQFLLLFCFFFKSIECKAGNLSCFSIYDFLDIPLNMFRQTDLLGLPLPLTQWRAVPCRPKETRLNLGI